MVRTSTDGTPWFEPHCLHFFRLELTSSQLQVECQVPPCFAGGTSPAFYGYKLHRWTYVDSAYNNSLNDDQADVRKLSSYLSIFRWRITCTATVCGTTFVSWQNHCSFSGTWGNYQVSQITMPFCVPPKYLIQNVAMGFTILDWFRQFWQTSLYSQRVTLHVSNQKTYST